MPLISEKYHKDKLNKLNINNVVQPVTSINPDNLHINSTITQTNAPQKENIPIVVTTLIGTVEKLKSVSITNRTFFERVHLLLPISRASLVYGTFSVLNPAHKI